VNNAGFSPGCPAKQCELAENARYVLPALVGPRTVNRSRRQVSVTAKALPRCRFRTDETSDRPENVTPTADTDSVLDLVLPLECGGCGGPSTRWCAACARQLAVKADQPHLITPRVDPGVPVLSLGRYAGARRQAIVALKEHGRADLIGPLASVLRSGLHNLLTWGLAATPLTIVPAPTRRSAARRRGGDPVTRMVRAATAGLDGVDVVQALRLRALVRDSVGLSGADRQRNIAGRVKIIKPVSGNVLLVDDIVTTGATAAESVRMLDISGAHVAGVLSIANA
jgi:predicted amidophosphoribosyltransferase